MVALEKSFSQQDESNNIVEVLQDLWLFGIKKGTVTVILKFANHPQLSQTEGGVLTENGIAGASSVIVGRKKLAWE